MFILQSIAGPSRSTLSARVVPICTARSFSYSARINAGDPSKRPQPARPYRSTVATLSPRPTPGAGSAKPSVNGDETTSIPSAASQPVSTPITLTKPTAVKPTSSPAGLSTLHVRPTREPTGPLFDRSYADWPWYRVKTDRPGVIVEERTIYARPTEMYSGRPQAIKVIWALGGLILVFVFVIPSMGDMPRLPVAEIPADAPNAAEMIASRYNNAEKIERNRELAASILDRTFIIKGVLSLIIGAGLFAATKLMANNVTRLVQIRETIKSSGTVVHRARFQTSLHDADLPYYGRNLETDLDKIRVRLISRRAQFVAMSTGAADKYRLDFTESQRLGTDSEDELVISLNRLERLFGELELSEPKASRFGEAVDRKLGGKK